MSARRDRAGERRHRPGVAGGGRVLHRPRADVDRRAAAVEELYVIIHVERAGVAAGGVELADHDRRRRRERSGSEDQGTDETGEEKQKNTTHWRLQSDGERDPSVVTDAAPCRQCPFAVVTKSALIRPRRVTLYRVTREARVSYGASR